MRFRILISFIILLSAVSCSKQSFSSNQYVPGTNVVEALDAVTVNEFIEDSYGYIWMSLSENGLVRYDGHSYVQYSSVKNDDRTLSANHINSMLVDDDKNFWVGTQKGVARFDYKTNTFINYRLDDFNSYVLNVVKDSRGDVYLLTRMALYLYDKSTDIFVRKLSLPIMSLNNPQILFDGYNSIWLRFDNILQNYNSSFELIKTVTLPENPSKMLSDGINSFIYVNNGQFKSFNTKDYSVGVLSSLNSALGNNYVNSFTHVKTNIILIDASDGSYSYDFKTKTVISEKDKGFIYKVSKPDFSLDLKYVDSKGNQWYSKNGGGYEVFRSANERENGHAEFEMLVRNESIQSCVSNEQYCWLAISNSLAVYDIEKQTIVSNESVKDILGLNINFPSLSFNGKDKLLLTSPYSSFAAVLNVSNGKKPELETIYYYDSPIYACFDKDDNLWAGTRGGHIVFADKDNKNGKVKMQETGLTVPVQLSYTSAAILLDNGNILFGFTDNHLMELDTEYRRIIDLEKDKPSRQIYYNQMLKDVDGNVWIGSSDSGLYEYDSSNSIVNEFSEFSDSNVSSLLEGPDSNFYFVTDSRNIYRYSFANKEFDQLWVAKNDIFTDTRLVQFPDSEIELFRNGTFIRFTSEQSDETSSKLISVSITSDNHLLSSITIDPKTDSNPSISIPTKKGNLFMLVSVLDPSTENVYSVNYSFGKRKPFVNNILGSSIIDLNDLRYGSNYFRLYLEKTGNLAAKHDIIKLRLFIKIPLIKFVAILLFIALCACVIVLCYIVVKNMRNAEKAEKERKLQEDINMKNLDFFANISHEFRSPLTLIKGAVDQIPDQISLTPQAERSVKVIKRNSDRMLKLVSQMLDFNQLDHNILKLHVHMDDISEIFQRVIDNFRIGAEQKSIDLILEGCEMKQPGWIDSDKLEKIIYNLLSNSMKYTPPGGQIIISATIDSSLNLSTSVIDNGIGFPEDKMDSLFQRFSRLNTKSMAGGTGIGLYYVKSLVNLHHGSIEAVNIYDNEKVSGAKVSFSLPIGQASYSEEERDENKDVVSSLDAIQNQSEYAEQSSESTNSSEDKSSIMLIDDDYELIYYLRSLLSDDYKVQFRFDVISGYAAIQEYKPDLILSDVMMADVDGLELCRRVKENSDICHIPVIMLTAKSTVEDQIKSMEVGADNYVTKPFNSSYLKALIASTLENRQRSRMVISSSTVTPDNNETVYMDAKDRQFMDNVFKIMEQSLNEGEIDINALATRVGVSRSKFFYKIKGLTGQTPNDFFTTYKLNRAAELLKQGDYKISAIAAMVGFNSPSHFASLFKKQFGVLPSQFFEQDI